MRTRFAGKADRLAGGALVGLLALFVSAPQSAIAGCNAHYVTSDARHETLTRFLDPLIAGETGRPAAGSPAEDSGDRPRPCSGPSCSGGPAAPAAPIVSVIRHVEPWACLVAVHLSLECNSRPLTANPLGARPSHVSTAIFHPPRDLSSLGLV